MDNRTYGIYSNFPFEWAYAFNGANFMKLTADIMNGTITDWWRSNVLQNNSDYFVSFRYYPIKLDQLTNLGTASATLYVGKTYANGYDNKRVTSVNANLKLFELSISRSFNNFLDYEPYTKFSLFVPFFETIDIPTQLAYRGTIYGYVSLDIKNGYLSLWVYTQKTTGSNPLLQTLIAHRRTKIAIDIPLGTTNAEEIQRNNLLQAISIIGNIASVGVGVGTANPMVVSMGATLLSKNTSQAISNNVFRLTGYKGSDGSTDGLTVDKGVHLIKETVQSVKYPNVTVFGKPCKRWLSLNILTGFVQISRMNFDPMSEPIMDDEIKEIDELLRSGVIF